MIIYCIECGAQRPINPQNYGRVRRCIPHQVSMLKQYRKTNLRRRARLKKFIGEPINNQIGFKDTVNENILDKD
jgi:hypothetical protein